MFIFSLKIFIQISIIIRYLIFKYISGGSITNKSLK